MAAAAATKRLRFSTTAPSLHPQIQEPAAAGLAQAVPEIPPQEHAGHVPQLGESSQAVHGVTYQADSILGKGSFGVVYRAFVSNSLCSVAIKVVRHRLGETNIEDAVLRRLRFAPNVVILLGSFLTCCGEDHRLNLVLEYLADTLQRIIKHHRTVARWMDLHDVRLYLHQIMRGLAALERYGVVHRDIKPANLLVHPPTKLLKICDFGTAKCLDHQAADNMPYLGSRYYRPPELILSCPAYGTSVDLWSAGCVFGEMLMGQPLFTGRDGIDQLGQIIDILGTPSAQELAAMNPDFWKTVGFEERVDARPFENLFTRSVGTEPIKVLKGLLQYDPSLRLPPLDGLAAPFFEPLWLQAALLPPHLFDFSSAELAGCVYASSANTMTSRLARFAPKAAG